MSACISEFSEFVRGQSIRLGLRFLLFSGVTAGRQGRAQCLPGATQRENQPTDREKRGVGKEKKKGKGEERKERKDEKEGKRMRKGKKELKDGKKRRK